MRQDPVYLAFLVQCTSREEADQFQERLRGETQPDSRMPVTTVSSEGTRQDQHRLGDYFQEILVLRCLDGDPAAIGLVFHRRPEAGRYWKDLMVRLIRSVEGENAVKSVCMVYKGEQCPEWGKPAALQERRHQPPAA